MKHTYINTITTILLLGTLLFGLVTLPACSTPAPRAQESVKPAVVDSITPQEAEQRLTEKKLEREALEAKRKDTLGEFYVPLPPLGKSLGESQGRTTVEAKALYLTAHVAGFSFQEEDITYYVDYIRAVNGESGKARDSSRLDDVNKLEKALAICEATEINALVIDIKNDDGLVAWNSDIAIVNRLGTNKSSPLKDYAKLLEYTKDHEIYSIARIVAFKDPAFAKLQSAHAIQLKAGGVYVDYSGMAWVNPFDDYVWKYVVAISQEAALRGFQEIQYDYVRFPDSAKRYNSITDFPGREGREKDEGIEQFLQYAARELAPYPVHLSADVFGIITRSWDDKPEDIGQTWRKIADNVDYICPMIYPSHYGSGQYGFSVPDQHPYEVMRLALLEAIERNAALKEPGLIRPWIQGFDATWVKGHIPYTPQVISEQIIAAVELGIKEYIVWNAANNYDPRIFSYHDQVGSRKPPTGETQGIDLLGRSPEQALDLYLTSWKTGSKSNRYLLTPITKRQAEYDDFADVLDEEGLDLVKYEILSMKTDLSGEAGTFLAQVKLEYKGPDGVIATREAQYQVLKENGVYKSWEKGPAAE